MNRHEREARAALRQRLDAVVPQLWAIARAAERLGYRGLEETFVEAAEQAGFAADLIVDEISGRYD